MRRWFNAPGNAEFVFACMFWVMAVGAAAVGAWPMAVLVSPVALMFTEWNRSRAHAYRHAYEQMRDRVVELTHAAEERS